MPTPVIQRTFAGGELSPALGGGSDGRYQAGLRTCRNFIVQRHGGAANRAGFGFLAEAKATTATRLFSFTLNSEQTYLIEAGHQYFRFFLNEEAILSAGVPYEVATPYSASDLDDLHAVQSGPVLTITHRSHAPRELTRTDHAAWSLDVITTAPAVSPPTGLAAVAGVAGTRTVSYQVTTVQVGDLDESVASSTVTLSASGEPSPTQPHEVTWSAATGALEYHVYKDATGNGVFGYLGTTTTTSFSDVGGDPDLGLTPPQPRSLFTASGEYPATAGYHQQRRLFASSTDEPEMVWGSRVGYPRNFTISSPLQDDDAITFRLSGTSKNEVKHLIGLKTLVAMTGTAEWTIGEPKVPLTPSYLPADVESHRGSSSVRPVVVGNAVLYVPERGTSLRDLNFDFQVDGFGGQDLTVFAGHLFEGYSIVKIAYAQEPHSVVWAVRSDGALLGCTYLRELQAWGWHRHDTAEGSFADICVVPEGDEDVLYAVVTRTVAGVERQYIERLHTRQVPTTADAFFVDSGITVEGPASSVSGLDHLNGLVVAVLADGHVLYNGDPDGENAENYRVRFGAIDLPGTYTTIQVGLPITADLETLDLDTRGSSVRGRRKQIPSVTLIVQASRGVFAGPDADHLFESQPPFADYETPIAPVTGEIEIPITTTWSSHGRVFLRQTDPLPVTVLAVIPNVELGG